MGNVNNPPADYAPAGGIHPPAQNSEAPFRNCGNPGLSSCKDCKQMGNLPIWGLLFSVSCVMMYTDKRKPFLLPLSGLPIGENDRVCRYA